MLREDYPDGSYAYICFGEVGSKLLDGLYGENVLEMEGSRSSRDPFFTKNNREPDPTDVRKAAYANFTVRAIGSLLGLKNLDATDLEKNGIDLSRVAKVEYQKGAEGGGNTTLISEAQFNRLDLIRKKAKVPDEAMQALCAAYGFANGRAISRTAYPEIVSCAELGTEKVKARNAELTTAKPAAPVEDDGSPEGAFA